MVIKTADGTENVSSNALGNTAVTLGAIGTGLGLLNGGMGMLGSTGRGYAGNGNDPNARFVTKAELDMVQQLQAKDILLASKDAEIALQKANQYTDQKIVDTYTVIQNRAKEIEAEVRANRMAQDAVNAQQMAYNATANASIATLQNQVSALSSVTKVYIPSSNVCESNCGCGCGCSSN